VDLVIARRPKADVAIPYPSKVEAVPAPKRLTMMPTVSIVTGYYYYLLLFTLGAIIAGHRAICNGVIASKI